MTDISSTPPHAAPAVRRQSAWQKLALGALLPTVLAFGVSLLLLPVASAQGRPATELRIGYQKGASLFVLQKAKGTLEKRLAPLGAGVKWVEFPAGPQLLEGLNVGSVEFKVQPVSDSVIAEQQKIADTFFELKLIPRAIAVRDAAWKPAL